MRFLLALLFIGSLAHAESSDFLENVGLSGTVTGNALTIALKTARGNNPSPADPVRIAFRSSTASSGAYVIRKITSAISLVVPSGTSLGCASGTECDLHVYALDNGGTVELAVATSYWTDELWNTTAISGGNTFILYSTAARTSKAIRLLGIIHATEATAGTWATAPSKIRLMPFHIELGPKFIGGIIYSGGQVTTPSGSVIAVSGLDGSMSYQGNSSGLGSQFGFRITSGLKPGIYVINAQFNTYAQSSVATACEIYGVSSIGGWGYAQVSQSNATADGPLFGVHFSGQRQTSYTGANQDFSVNWRRVAGSGTCIFKGGAGDASYMRIEKYPLINGGSGGL